MIIVGARTMGATAWKSCLYRGGQNFNRLGRTGCARLSHENHDFIRVTTRINLYGGGRIVGAPNKNHDFTRGTDKT